MRNFQTDKFNYSYAKTTCHPLYCIEEPKGTLVIENLQFNSDSANNV